MLPRVMYNPAELVSAALGNEGLPTQAHSLVQPLYYTIYLQTNEFYAGDQKLWASFSIQLAKLFLTTSSIA